MHAPLQAASACLQSQDSMYEPNKRLTHGIETFDQVIRFMFIRTSVLFGIHTYRPTITMTFGLGLGQCGPHLARYSDIILCFFHIRSICELPVERPGRDGQLFAQIKLQRTNQSFFWLKVIIRGHVYCIHFRERFVTFNKHNIWRSQKAGRLRRHTAL